MEILINCGKGLEAICETEWRKKCIYKNYSIFQEDGRLRIEFLDQMTTEQEKQLRSTLLTIRCFEKIFLIVNETEAHIPRKLIVEAQIRSHIEESFAIISLKSFLPTIEILSCNKKPTLKQIQFQCPDINPKLTQKQILGVIQKIAKRFGFSTEFKRENLPFSIWIGTDNIRTLLDLNYPIGNLLQMDLHPTGLFPSFAYGLIQSALIHWIKENPVKPKEPIQIIDPMMGAGMIPLLCIKEFEEQKSPILEQKLQINVFGIEKETSFFEKAQKNLKNAIKTKKIQVYNQEFQSIQPPQPYDLIITQPPYGYSIQISDQDLTQLHNDLFEWAAKNSKKGAILAMITPRDSILNSIEQNQEKTHVSDWKRIGTVPIKEHTLHCNYFIYVRLEQKMEQQTKEKLEVKGEEKFEEKAPKSEKRTKSKKK